MGNQIGSKIPQELLKTKQETEEQITNNTEHNTSITRIKGAQQDVVVK